MVVRKCPKNVNLYTSSKIIKVNVNRLIPANNNNLNLAELGWLNTCKTGLMNKATLLMASTPQLRGNLEEFSKAIWWPNA